MVSVFKTITIALLVSLAVSSSSTSYGMDTRTGMKTGADGIPSDPNVDPAKKVNSSTMPSEANTTPSEARMLELNNILTKAQMYNYDDSGKSPIVASFPPCDFSDCDIEYILTQLPDNVISLSLSDCRFQTLPTSIKKFSGLQTLSLPINQDLKVYKEALQALSSLKSISCPEHVYQTLSILQQNRIGAFMNEEAAKKAEREADANENSATTAYYENKANDEAKYRAQAAKHTAQAAAHKAKAAAFTSDLATYWANENQAVDWKNGYYLQQKAICMIDVVAYKAQEFLYKARETAYTAMMHAADKMKKMQLLVQAAHFLAQMAGFNAQWARLMGEDQHPITDEISTIRTERLKYQAQEYEYQAQEYEYQAQGYEYQAQEDKYAYSRGDAAESRVKAAKHWADLAEMFKKNARLYMDFARAEDNKAQKLRDFDRIATIMIRAAECNVKAAENKAMAESLRAKVSAGQKAMENDISSATYMLEASHDMWDASRIMNDAARFMDNFARTNENLAKADEYEAKEYEYEAKKYEYAAKAYEYQAQKLKLEGDKCEIDTPYNCMRLAYYNVGAAINFINRSMRKHKNSLERVKLGDGLSHIAMLERAIEMAEFKAKEAALEVKKAECEVKKAEFEVKGNNLELYNQAYIKQAKEAAQLMEYVHQLSCHLVQTYPEQKLKYEAKLTEYNIKFEEYNSIAWKSHQYPARKRARMELMAAYYSGGVFEGMKYMLYAIANNML